jgi:hypothetical protein
LPDYSPLPQPTYSVPFNITLDDVIIDESDIEAQITSKIALLTHTLESNIRITSYSYTTARRLLLAATLRVTFEILTPNAKDVSKIKKNFENIQTELTNAFRGVEEIVIVDSVTPAQKSRATRLYIFYIIYGFMNGTSTLLSFVIYVVITFFVKDLHDE